MKITKDEFNTLANTYKLLCNLQDRAELEGQFGMMRFIDNLRHEIDYVRFSSKVED